VVTESRRAAAADIGIVLSVVVALAVVPYLWAAGAPHRIAALWSRWYLLVVFTCLVELAAILLVLRHRHEPLSSIGLGPVSLRRELGLTLVAVPLCYLVVAVISLMVALSGAGFGGVVTGKGRVAYALGGIPLRLIVPISLLVGLAEEVLFRGFLLSRLRALMGGTTGPVLLSSALFGAAHFAQGPVGMADTAAIGLVLAVLVVRTRTLWPAIAAHGIIDTLSLILAVLVRERLRTDG
jgi:uncharacterized protein